MAWRHHESQTEPTPLSHQGFRSPADPSPSPTGASAGGPKHLGDTRMLERSLGQSVRLRITDPTGRTGFVTEDLDVDYGGEWRPYVERLIDDVCEDCAEYAEDPEEYVSRVFQELVTVLPQRLPIRDVELVED